MKSKFYLIALLAGMSLLFFCSDDDDDKDEKTKVDSGVMLCCQGSWGNGNASLWVYKVNEGTWVDTLSAVGDVVDDGISDDDRVLAPSYGDNQLLVYYPRQAELDSVDLSGYGPQEAAVNNNKIYVTGDDADSLIVLNGSDYSKKTVLPCGNDPWFIVSYDKYVLVSCYGMDEQTYAYEQGIVKVLNSETDEWVKDINVGVNPGDLKVVGNSLFVLCRGNYATINTKIYEIALSDWAVKDSLDLGVLGAGNLYHDGEDYLYVNVGYNAASKLVRFHTTLSSSSVEDYLGYGNSILFLNDNIYVTTMTDYTSQGTFYKLDKNKTKLDSLKTGIGPSCLIPF